MAPISDEVAASDGNRGAIGLLPLRTLNTSCFGSLIEGQTVLFSATAFRWGTSALIAAASWSFTCTPLSISRMSAQSFTACQASISCDAGPGFHGMSVQDDAGRRSVSESAFGVNGCRC
jgi:hypothetical protein